VRETIQAAQQRFPTRRLFAVLEPRSYTAQRREFQEAFEESLAAASHVVLAGLFHPERYDQASGLNPLELIGGLNASGVEAHYIPQVDEIINHLLEHLTEGDLVLVMSNGGFGGIHEKLLEVLRERGSRAPS
jgi:UDP-N-acetylmuramate: L-alanyl-gamma-D-glutamyl-meso-diaminopimelate ligase